MPNWCSNNLEIYGSKKDIAKFAATIKGDTFTLSQTLPMPEELKGILSGSCTIAGKQCSYWTETGEGENKVQVPVSDQKLKALEKKYGAKNWYDWNVTNYGTKWDVEGTPQISDKNISVHFDSAWSPPIEWMKKVSEMFPKLNFELHYCEAGCDYWGTTTAKNGEVEENTRNGVYLAVEGDEYSDDPDDNLNPEVREFLEEHGLHTGG